MYIAVVGAGFAGLATAWFLKKNPGIQVDLFDERGVGGGASGIAAGLLHPYVGEEGKRSQGGSLALQESVSLIESVQDFVGKRVMKNGLIRYLPLACQQKQFEEHEKIHGDVRRLSIDRFWIDSGYTVDCPLYLNGLWNMLEEKGSRLHKEAVNSTEEILKKGYDAVLIAAGKGSLGMGGVGAISASLVKGQVLIGSFGKRATLPEVSLVGKGYIAIQERKCILGSTYEKISDPAPDLELCRNQLFPKLLQIYPDLDLIEGLEAKAAFRVCMRGHYFPLLRKESDRVWVLTGLGSRGLLYHALLGKQAAAGIVASRSS